MRGFARVGDRQCCNTHFVRKQQKTFNCTKLRWESVLDTPNARESNEVEMTLTEGVEVGHLPFKPLHRYQGDKIGGVPCPCIFYVYLDELSTQVAFARADTLLLVPNLLHKCQSLKKTGCARRISRLLYPAFGLRCLTRSSRVIPDQLTILIR